MIEKNDCANQQVSIKEYMENLHLPADHIEDLDAVRAVAVERNLPIVDHTAHRLAQIPFPIAWMSDAFHPAAAGHEAMYLHQSLTGNRRHIPPNEYVLRFWIVEARLR